MNSCVSSSNKKYNTPHINWQIEWTFDLTKSCDIQENIASKQIFSSLCYENIDFLVFVATQQHPKNLLHIH